MMSGIKLPIFDEIAIVGVGLIGGSIGLGARKRGLVGRVLGIGRSEQKLMRAKILGAIDDYSLDIENAASNADLTIICTPVSLIIPTLQKMSKSFKTGSIVTDVGSTKSEVMKGASGILDANVYFIGGHPMAGSEQAGVDAARADLYENATYVLTAYENTNLTALEKLSSFVELLGANVIHMTPEEHDNAAAIISHLPHLISGALLEIAEKSQKSGGKALNLAAGSFRDLTRISDSPPEIWHDICISNASSIRKALSDFSRILKEIDEALEKEDSEKILSFFEHARQIREVSIRISKL